MLPCVKTQKQKARFNPRFCLEKARRDFSADYEVFIDTTKKEDPRH